LSRYAATFAFLSDIALLTLGGALKRREMLSARLGDILSELYLLSAALKRWEDEGRQEADLPVLEWVMETGFKTIQLRTVEVLSNLPNRPVAWALRALIQPFGTTRHGPRDALTQACAQLLLEPSATRDRITAGLFAATDDSGPARIERAFLLVHEVEPLRKRMRAAHVSDLRAAQEKGIITELEAQRLAAAQDAVRQVIDVDDFTHEELTRHDARGGTSQTRAAS
jgi:acyl-CoA dehydrogenase